LTSPIDYALSFFQGAKKKKDGWWACCPSHTERTGSFRISEGEDGKVLLKCFGCNAPAEDLARAAGMEMSKLFPEGSRPERPLRSSGGTDHVCSYIYQDAQGGNYMRVRRLLTPSGKSFRQDRWENGKWVAGLAGRAAILYHLPEILAAIEREEPIWVFEGEKDADNARRWGLNATSSPMGAGKFLAAHAESLKGADVRFVPDNDQVGRDHCALGASLCHGLAASVRIVPLPGLTEEHADFSDWQALGHTREQLEALAEAAPLWQPGVAAAGESAEEEEFHPDAEVLEFPVQVLPFTLRTFCEAVAEAVNCPVDLPALFVLTVAGTAIGNSYAIAIKPGWVEPPILWTAVVGVAGSAKTPAMRAAMEPLKKYQSRLQAEFKERKKQYAADLDAYNRELAVIRDNARKNKANFAAPPEQPVEPVMSQIIANDATREALAQLLHANPRSMVYEQDELAGWVGAMDAYRQGGDRPWWLSCWSATSIMVNRVGKKEPLWVPRPFISVTGGIQPSLLSDLIATEGKEDGFTPRILWCFPDPWPEDYDENGVDDATRSEYQQVIDYLLQLQPAGIEEAEMVPHVVGMSPDGKETWRKWIDGHNAEMNHPDFAPRMYAPWAKFRTYCARLALILHLCRWACGETTSEQVDRKSILAAAALVAYFKTHARRAHDWLHADGQDKQIQLAVAWLRRRGGTGTAREMQRYKVANVKTRDDAQLLAQLLKSRGYARLERGEKGSLTVHLTCRVTVESSVERSPVPTGTPLQAQNGRSVECRVGGDTF